MSNIKKYNLLNKKTFSDAMNDTYWVEWIIVATIESTYSMKECLKMVKKEMKAKGLAFSFSEKYGDYQLLEIANE